MPFDTTYSSRALDKQEVSAVASQIKTLLEKNETVKGVGPKRTRLLCYLLRRWLKYRFAGEEETHPGKAEMAKRAHMTKRGVQDALREFKDKEFLVAVGFERGGRGNATEFAFDIFSLIRWLKSLPRRPTKMLLERLEMIAERIEMIPLKGEVTSPRVIDNYCYSSSNKNVVPRSSASASNIQPDRFSSTVAPCVEDPAPPCDDALNLQSLQDAAQWEPCAQYLSHDPNDCRADEWLGHIFDAEAAN